MTTPHVLARPVPSTPSSSAQEPPARGETLSIQDAARFTGVPAHTLRWYERVGLLPDVPRCPTGRRRFTGDNLHWVSLLRSLRATGMPVATLQDLTEHHHEGRAEQPLRIVRTHRAQVLALMGQLQRSLAVLDVIEAYVQRPRADVGPRAAHDPR